LGNCSECEKHFVLCMLVSLFFLIYFSLVQRNRLFITVQLSSRLHQAGLGSFQYTTMKTLLSSTATSNLPTLASTPGTPPDMDELLQRKQLDQLLEKQKLAEWRKAIIETSTEHTEQMKFSQKRFWVLNQYVDGPTAFNIAYLGQLTGRLCDQPSQS
jgi:hypothetical protein